MIWIQTVIIKSKVEKCEHSNENIIVSIIHDGDQTGFRNELYIKLYIYSIFVQLIDITVCKHVKKDFQ